MRVLKFAGCLSVVAVAFGDSAALVEAVLGPEVPSSVGKGPLVTGGESYNPALHKPKIAQVFKAMMVEFVYPSSTAPLCEDVIAALMNYEGTADAHISLTVVQGLLDGSAMDCAADHVQADKNMEVQLTQLASQMIREGASDGHGDLVHHMGDVITCISDVASQRTLLQQMVFKGMEKSLKTPFAAQLYRGTSNYDPSRALDKFGHNMLHLAVMSGAVSMVQVVMYLEQQKNKEDATRRGNYCSWMAKCLEHTDNDGLAPLKHCKTTTQSDALKRSFRTMALYYRVMAKRHGIVEVEEQMTNTFALLQTSSTIAAKEAERMAGIAPPAVGSQPPANAPTESQMAAAA